MSSRYTWISTDDLDCIVPVPYMDTLKKMHFFHPRLHVIGLQKCMTTIPGLLNILKKKTLCKCSSLILMIKTKKFLQMSIKGATCPNYGHPCVY